MTAARLAERRVTLGLCLLLCTQGTSFAGTFTAATEAHIDG